MYQAQIIELAAALRLPHDHGMQDWGIESANAERLEEFVEFAQREFHAGWHPEVVRELVNLLLESAGDALADNPSLELPSLREWLSANVAQLQRALAYWIELGPEDWPIVAKLDAWGLRIVFVR
jgi:hypothetical protein